MSQSKVDPSERKEIEIESTNKLTLKFTQTGPKSRTFSL